MINGLFFFSKIIILTRKTVYYKIFYALFFKNRTEIRKIDLAGV